MKIEDLLKSRYKVIADYPNSPFRVGDILENYPAPTDVYINQRTGVAHHTSVQSYKAIFKPLQWWEERTDEELDSVKYVRNLSGGKILKVLPASRDFQTFHTDGSIERRFVVFQYPTLRYIPVTEQEYIDSTTLTPESFNN